MPRPDRPDDRREHVNIDVGLFTHRKLAVLRDPVAIALAGWLWCALIAESKRSRGDGHVVLLTVQRTTGLGDDVAKNLIAEGLVHEDGHDCPKCPQPRRGCVYIHDYLHHQFAAAFDERVKADRARAGAAGGSARVAAASARRARREALLGPLANVAPGSVRAARIAKPPKKRVKAAPKSYDPIVVRLCEYLAKWIVRNGSKAPKIGDSWLNSCRLMIEVDKRDPDDIKAMIEYCQRDDFEKSNILSMPTLRRRYDSLRLKRGRRTPGFARPARGTPGAINVDNIDEGFAAEMLEMESRRHA